MSATSIFFGVSTKPEIGKQAEAGDKKGNVAKRVRRDDSPDKNLQAGHFP